MKTIIFLHGFPASPDAWSAVVYALSKTGYEVLLPKQRGYNEALRPKCRRDYKLSLLAKDIVDLMDKKGIKQAHVVGHDWGGVVAWALASWYPDRIATLSVVSTPHPKAFFSSLLSKQIILSWYMFFFQFPWLPEYFLTKQHGKRLQQTLEKTGLNKISAERYMQYMLAPGRLTGALNWYRAVPYSLSEFKKIGTIKTPTLFVYGGKDAYLSAKSVELTKQWAGGIYEQKRVPNGTHWLPEEFPELLAGEIETFIRRAENK